MTTFRNLSPTQSVVFEQIATGNDAAHNRRTLAALVRKELIVEEEQPKHFYNVAMAVRRYYVPVGVHMEWCAWCAEQFENTEAQAAYEIHMENQQWLDALNRWEQAGQKCGCGRPISFEDAYELGSCGKCRQAKPEDIPF